jgi:deazaflavin-dependent oxidoreductase (nitroreductase family)
MTVADEPYCYLTTTGRVSGEPREIEIWFGLERDTVYMLAQGRERADWVKNLRRDPTVSVRIGGETIGGRARIVDEPDEDARARELVAGKYGRLDSDWRRTALPVAVDLDRPGPRPSGRAADMSSAKDRPV